MKEMNQYDADALTKKIIKFYDDNPYVKYLGIRIVSLAWAEIKLAMNIEAEIHSNTYGKAHGGALMSLADTAMGAVCLTVGKKVVTLEMNINCIKSVPSGCLLYAVARILHDGTRTIVAECEIIGEDGKLYAKSRGSFYIVDQFTE